VFFFFSFKENVYLTHTETTCETRPSLLSPQMKWISSITIITIIGQNNTHKNYVTYRSKIIIKILYIATEEEDSARWNTIKVRTDQQY